MGGWSDVPATIHPESVPGAISRIVQEIVHELNAGQWGARWASRSLAA
jgi:hypothetical protein